MSTELKTSIALGIAWRFTSDDDPRYAVDRNQIVADYEWLDGALADQADCVWYQQLTITDGGSVSISVSGGENDAFGEPFTLDAIRAVVVANRNSDRGEILTVGGGTDPVAIFANATDAVEVGPGGTFVLVLPATSGYQVVQGASDQLWLSAAGADITADVAIVGIRGVGGGPTEMVLVTEEGDMLVNELGEELEIG